MTRYLSPQSAILDILERLLWWVLAMKSAFHIARKIPLTFAIFATFAISSILF